MKSRQSCAAALNEAESRSCSDSSSEQQPAPDATRAIRVGDTVELLKLGTKATVLAINKDGTLSAAGGHHEGDMQSRTRCTCWKTRRRTKAKKIIEGKVRELKAAAQPELDIRGMAADEAHAGAR